ncbi:MAG: hypothetical protein K8H88_09945, partial [Sandaracinaceae bacterium]|nr:hypothetical protein [Sandaracinaceae bacterium]
LMTQKADGRFLPSPELDAWLGGRATKLADAIAKHGEAIVTAVVIALFDREARGRESEWRPAVGKAERWLAKQGTSVERAVVDAVLA